MSDQKQRKQREPHVFDDAKLRLYGPVMKEGGKKASFRIKIYENNPVILVDYGFSTDKGYKVTHETPLDPIVFRQFLMYLSQVAKASGACEFVMDNDGHPFIWDRDQGKNIRSKDRMNVSRVEIGKSDTGVVYMRYCTHRNDDVLFEFAESPMDYHRWKLPSGEPAPVNRTSANMALAWADVMEQTYFPYFSLKWTEPEYRRRFRMEQAQKRNGGGGGQKSGQGGGYSNNSSQNAGQGGGYTPPADDGDYGDDIPF